MAAVILNPNSNTNHSDKYVVVDFAEWSAYRYGARLGFTIHSRHDTYDQASEACDKQNEKEREGDRV